MKIQSYKSDWKISPGARPTWNALFGPKMMKNLPKNWQRRFGSNFSVIRRQKAQIYSITNGIISIFIWKVDFSFSFESLRHFLSATKGATSRSSSELRWKLEIGARSSSTWVGRKAPHNGKFYTVPLKDRQDQINHP